MTKYICKACSEPCTFDAGRSGSKGIDDLNSMRCNCDWREVEEESGQRQDQTRIPGRHVATCDSPGVPSQGVSESELSNYRIWRTPHGQMFLPVDWDGKVDKEVVFYPPGHCPGCKEKDVEIRRLILNLDMEVRIRKGADEKIDRLKAKVARHSESICDLNETCGRNRDQWQHYASLSQKKGEEITRLKHSLSDIATGLNDKLLDCNRTLAAERKKVAKLEAESADCDRSVSVQLLKERAESREKVERLENTLGAEIAVLRKERDGTRAEADEWEETAGRMSDRASKLDGEIEDLKVAAHDRIVEIERLKEELVNRGAPGEKRTIEEATAAVQAFGEAVINLGERLSRWPKDTNDH
ncbi:MAG: hypothetical protein U9Q07_03930 [Planctomycetota bacterium]|nr:hypothetical protein [Planctomycetota bacterium]